MARLTSLVMASAVCVIRLLRALSASVRSVTSLVMALFSTVSRATRVALSPRALRTSALTLSAVCFTVEMLPLRPLSAFVARSTSLVMLSAVWVIRLLRALSALVRSVTSDTIWFTTTANRAPRVASPARALRTSRLTLSAVCFTVDMLPLSPLSAFVARLTSLLMASACTLKDAPRA